MPDEVFLLGDDDCPRCKGKDKAELFAQEVISLHDHLARSKRTMWRWGDRLLDGESTGFGEWEASTNKTHGALGRIPKDIVICDWHYERALQCDLTPPTPSAIGCRESYKPPGPGLPHLRARISASPIPAALCRPPIS